jgi:hypothetical protein
VPNVIGANSRVARQEILFAGLVPRFSGPLTNSEVDSQSPEGGDVVDKGSTVKLNMIRTPAPRLQDPLTQIRITVTTGEKSVGTRDKVYLGIAGREFRCRKEGDDDANPFHLRNQTSSLTFGIGNNVEDTDINDPRNPIINVADIFNFPVYIRTQPNARECKRVESC